MREILFRGKDILTGEWLYGDLIQSANEEDVKFIVPFNETSTRGIIPETIGQFTGLTDKNGTRIFEGDIVNRSRYDIELKTFCKTLYTIEWCENCAMFLLPCITDENMETDFQVLQTEEDCEVIGNIYDNPELLKDGDKAK